MNKFDYTQIPEIMRPGLLRYVNKGVIPGDFLQAIITNDLRGACSYADDDNIEILPVYIMWLVNCVPGGCFGSPAQMKYWHSEGGLEGLMNQSLTMEAFEK